MQILPRKVKTNSKTSARSIEELKLTISFSASERLLAILLGLLCSATSFGSGYTVGVKQSNSPLTVPGGENVDVIKPSNFEQN